MTRARAARLGLALAAVSAVLAGAPLLAHADEVLRDEWQVLSIGGAPSGHVHLVVRRLSDPSRIESTTESLTKMRRLDMTIDVSSSETTVEKEDGTLVSIVAREKQSTVETLTEIAFEGTKARVKTTQMGQSREASVDVPAGLLGPWRAERIPFEAGYPAGKTFETKTFLREMGGANTSVTKVVGPEEPGVAGALAKDTIRLDQSFEGLPIRAAVWVDSKGSPVASQMTIAGMLIETRRAAKEEALAGGDAKKPTPDLFTSSLIVSKVLVPHARSLDSATLRLRPRTKDASIPDLADSRQTVVRREPDGSVVLRIRRTVPPDAAATRPISATPPDVAPFLAPSSTLQSDAPAIAAAAKDAVGDEKDAWKAAQAIEAWVEKNLTKKNMGVAFASALEVCQNREGDCTEHAVLVAAMLRAAGIPSRVVMGLEYLAGIFGGHAWSEAWIAGSWYALDGTLGYGSVDALHVSVGASAMAEGSFGQEFKSLIAVVGSVDIEVLDATWKGRTFAVSDPAAIRVDGSRYENRLFDLAFSAPKGFTVEAVIPKGLEDRLATVRGKTASGGDVLVSVHVDDLPAGGLKKQEGATETKVDGRTAFSRPRKRGGHATRVLVEDTVFTFAVEPSEAAEREVLDAMLATVDLDPPK